MVKTPEQGERFDTDRMDRMPWRELARFATDTRVPAHQRKRLEQRLARCLEGLSLGEQVALARIAPRAVLADLAGLHRPEVLGAVLGNPRTTAGDLLDILRDEDLPPDGLRKVAEHHRWSTLLPVRLALLTHPATPLHPGLKILDTLPREEILGLIRRGSLSPVLEIHAVRIMGEDDR